MGRDGSKGLVLLSEPADHGSVLQAWSHSGKLGRSAAIKLRKMEQTASVNTLGNAGHPYKNYKCPNCWKLKKI